MKQFEDILNNIEIDLKKMEHPITKKINELSKRINCELKQSVDLSADATSYRQVLIDEKTNQYYKMYKELRKLKQMKKKHFEHYSTKYAINLNGGEKTKLIDADMAYHDAKMDFFQNHINFLTESIKTIDHVIYSIKNKIDMFNITGLD